MKNQKLSSYGPDDLLGTASLVAAVCKVSRWTVQAVIKASKGQPDSPFSGRYTTKARFNKWILDHPEFSASKVLRKPKVSEESKLQPAI